MLTIRFRRKRRNLYRIRKYRDVVPSRDSAEEILKGRRKHQKCISHGKHPFYPFPAPRSQLVIVKPFKITAVLVNHDFFMKSLRRLYENGFAKITCIRSYIDMYDFIPRKL